MKIHLARDGQKFGPYSEAEVAAYLRTGRVLPSDLAWRIGCESWLPVSQLFPRESAAPPPPLLARPPLSGYADAQIRTLAKTRTHLAWLVAGWGVWLLAASVTAEPPLPGLFLRLGESLMPFLALALCVLGVITVAKLTVALRKDHAWLFPILALHPFVAVILLCVFGAEANRLLRGRGIRVGLFGPLRGELERHLQA